MYGRSRDLSRAIYSSQNKHKAKSSKDQEFDHVCYEIPYDTVEDSTKIEVKFAVEVAGFLKTKKCLSPEEIENKAKELYETNGLDWDTPVTNRDIIDTLVKQASCKDNFDPSVDKDLSFSLPPKGSVLLESVIYYNKGKSKLEDKLEKEDIPPPKPKTRKRRLGTILRVKSKKPVITEENTAPPAPLVDISNNNTPSNSNNNNNTDNNNPLSDSSSSTNFSLTKQLVKSKNNNLEGSKSFYGSKTSWQSLFEDAAVKKPRLEMMSDYPDDHEYHHVTNGDTIPYCNVATLFNMGNTCFLNSVLYTLRFAPTFLHNLHHLLIDLTLINTKLKENKTKTSSLGRNGSAVSGSSWRSTSSKDLLSIGNNDIIPKTKDQIVTEKLHALFMTMNNLEAKDSPDPYQPEALLQAIRDVNPLFEGNHQQDAHEFFVELLSCLRVTCDKLNEQIEQYPELIKPPEPTSANVNNNSKLWGVRRSWKKPLKKKEKGSAKKNGEQENEVAPVDSEDNLSTDESGDSNKKKFGYNFIAEDFQGVSLHRTICLECEEVSELKEPFLEIQVPVNYREEDFGHDVTESSIFGSVCVTSEKLCDQNKYFCENCNRYNEAVRTVLYEKLPNIMVLHLKRFTTSSSGVQKVNTYVPTPLEIRCFCESCSKNEKSKTTPHKYRLSCVIMHLGASMASGHYIAYSRASVPTVDYMECKRDNPKNYLNSSGKEISANLLKFFKNKALGNSLSETQNGLGPYSKKNDTQICQSINCCGIKNKLNIGSPNHSDDWLEFDDEKVKTLSNKEFMDMLNRRHESTNTPYLLFYSKM